MARFPTKSLLLATTVAATACSDLTSPPRDDTSYDLLFESMASPQENQSHIYVLRAGAAAAVPLFNDQSYGTQPRVSLDGRWVAYIAPRPEDGAGAIWLANVDGTQRRQVFTSSGESLLWPAPSPDGSRIAFQAYDEVTGSSKIWIVNANGSGAFAITTEPHAAPFVHTAPAWSPDGTRIALAMGAPGSLRLAIMSATGGALTVLTQPAAGSDTEPHWAPTGTHLVFARTTSPAASDLMVVNVANGATGVIYAGNAHHPAWSPNGQLILFSARPPGEPDELFAISTIDGSTQRVTSNAVADRHPNWARHVP